MGQHMREAVINNNGERERKIEKAEKERGAGM